jgi:aspartyl-tRNA(Asn)/glutamyl-tRNA(Gln) amidotransferase subunit A
VPVEFLGEGVEPGVERAVREAIAVLRELGARVEELSLPHAPYGIPTYYIVATAEASSNLARYDGVRYGHRTAEPVGGALEMVERTRGEGFGPEVKRRIMLGTYALSAGYYEAYYRRALQVRRRIKEDFDRAFARCDLLAFPTSPTVAFRLGERTEDPLAMYLSDVCTISVNLAGLPAVSIPCGFAGGLPVGLQLVGRPFEEAVLLRVADAYQRVTDHHRRRPALAAAASEEVGGR